MLPFSYTPILLALLGGPMAHDSLRGWAAQAASVIERERGQRSATDAPAYVTAAREVSNWRREAVDDLQPAPVSALAVLLQVERPVVTRCVKLNNYWCIKRARWSGEIGYDEEGHVGFATADHGADAAVTLLRRYYLEFGRKSALDIVRRWAPAECRAGPSFSSPTLAVRGIGMTLRARWLAAQRAKMAPRPAGQRQRTRTAAAPAGKAQPRPAAPARASAVPLRPLPTFRVPDIAAGLGERRVATVSSTLAAPSKRRQLTSISSAGGKAGAGLKAAGARTEKVEARAPALVSPSRLRVASTASTAALPAAASGVCGVDELRIRNYAARIVAGLDLQPTDDLKLFEANGTPMPNLPRVMLAMSTVELGILRASMELIEGAILRATDKMQASAFLRRADPPPVP